MTPRDLFNGLVASNKLRVLITDTDGWHRSFVRADGLSMWRIKSGYGVGIQTAWLIDGRLAGHYPYYRNNNMVAALAAAVERENDLAAVKESLE